MASFLLPRYVDGHGLAWLFCSDEAAERFRFHRIRDKWPELATLVNAQELELAGAGQENRPDSYRIAVPGQWASGAAAKVRFRLGKRTPKATLEVIAHHLSEERIDWLFFTDASGSKVTTPRLRTHYLLNQLLTPKAAPHVNA